MTATLDLTAAERIFGLASEDPLVMVERRARRFGRRFFHCVNGLGGCDFGIAGTEFPLTPAELEQHERATTMVEHPERPCAACGTPMRLIEIVPPDDRACPWCGKPVEPGQKRALAIDTQRWYHDECITPAAGERLTEMATHKYASKMPPCTNCGLEYNDHTFVNGNGFCDLPHERYYETRYMASAPYWLSHGRYIVPTHMKDQTAA